MTTACSNFGLVSIVMPAYNSEPFIEESIRSVQSQTYGDWELLIVDDCSTDKTISIANEIACGDSRIHVFQNKQTLVRLIQEIVRYERPRVIGLHFLTAMTFGIKKS